MDCAFNSNAPTLAPAIFIATWPSVSMTSSSAHAMTSGVSWRQRVEVCACMLSIPLAAQRGWPVEPVDAREFVEACEYPVHETVAVAIPQHVGLQRAAEARLLAVQSLAALVHADPLVDAVPHVLQPTHMVEVVAVRRCMVHAEELVERSKERRVGRESRSGWSRAS